MTWWVVPILVLGVLMILAPAIGGWLARHDHPVACPACGRELIGSPPEHRLSDRAHCAETIAYQSSVRRLRSQPPWRQW